EPLADLLRAFPARATIGENEPTGPDCLNLLWSESFIFTVVPFDQIGIDSSLRTESGQLTCFTGALQGARQHQGKVYRREHRLQSPGQSAAILRQRNIGYAGVLPAHAPLGLTMTNQIDGLLRHYVFLFQPVFLSSFSSENRRLRV